MTMIIENFMTPLPHTIGVDRSLRDAWRVMQKHSIRHLPVLSGGQLVGVVSVGDLNAVDSWIDAPAADVPVEQAMTPEPYTVPPTQPLSDVCQVMAEHKYGCCIVRQGLAVVGVFTVVDACRTLSQLLNSSAAID